jgi:serine protease Do
VQSTLPHNGIWSNQYFLSTHSELAPQNQGCVTTVETVEWWMHYQLGHKETIMKSHHSRTFMLAAAIVLMFRKENLESGFASLATRTVPAVVNIASPTMPILASELIDVPPSARKNGLWSLGSGVIFRHDGYIVTNCHVIDGVSDIRASMSDGRVLNARIVGVDAKTDIAVLKVDAAGLPVLRFADSVPLHVGDIALAIGDPFGLRHTVTLGIISGTGRSGLGILAYENFIQTDAAINPGSSGGALINTQGQLIGIVTAGKQYTGVGLAVPAEMLASITQQILAHGRVIRGWLGAVSQPLTDSTARAFGLSGGLRGVLVADVSAASPAQRAGLAPGDIVLAANGSPLDEPGQLNLLIAGQSPGATVNLAVYRQGQERNLTVVLSEEPPNTKPRVSPEPSGPAGMLGISVTSLPKQLSQDLNQGTDTPGVIITDVRTGSRASAAELVENDVILEINRKAVMGVDDFYDAVYRSHQLPILLLIERAGNRMFVVIEPQN